MIQLFDIKPCSDYPDAVQSEGIICDDLFSLTDFEQMLVSKEFTVYSIGNPVVLICRRPDCMLFVKSDGSFNISQVLTEEILLQIIHEIEALIRMKQEIKR